MGPDQGPAYTIEEAFELIEAALDDGVTWRSPTSRPRAIPSTWSSTLTQWRSTVAWHSRSAISTSISGSGGIAGRVLAGPTCPVQKDPPDPDCADRPVTGAVLVVFDSSGQEVTRAASNPELFRPDRSRSGKLPPRTPAGRGPAGHGRPI